MRLVAVRVNSVLIEWERRNGVYQRGGWTVGRNGFILAMHERWLVVALVKAWRRREEGVWPRRVISPASRRT